MPVKGIFAEHTGIVHSVFLIFIVQKTLFSTVGQVMPFKKLR